MNKKQTSVEWLVSQIVEDQIIKAKSVGEWVIIFEQAKEMEKEQMRKFYLFDPYNTQYGFKQYYNETYGKEG